MSKKITIISAVIAILLIAAVSSFASGTLRKGSTKTIDGFKITCKTVGKTITINGEQFRCAKEKRSTSVVGGGDDL